MEAETLFYTCCDRIDKDLETAEMLLVGCIAYIIRDRGEKGVRKFIRNDLSMSNYSPYTRELKFISTMQDDSLHALVTSSMNISPILRYVTILYEHAKDTDYDLVQPSTHANKAKRAADMMNEIASKMKPTKKIKTDCSLFSEGI